MKKRTSENRTTEIRRNQGMSVFHYQFFSSKLLALFCLNLGFKLKIFPGLISLRIFTTFIFVKTWRFTKFPNICWKWLQSIKCRKEDMVLSRGWKFWFAFYQTFKEWSPLYLPTYPKVWAFILNLFWLVGILFMCSTLYRPI